MPIYMEYDGIEGNVTMAGYEKQIAVLNMQWGVGRGITMVTGRTANREASTASISEVTVTKEMDKATALLVQEATVGTKGKEVKLHLTRTGADGEEEIMTYTLHDTLVSSYSVSSSGSGEPIENVSLSFTKIEMAFSESGKDNAKGGTGRFGYSIETGKKL